MSCQSICQNMLEFEKISQNMRKPARPCRNTTKRLKTCKYIRKRVKTYIFRSCEKWFNYSYLLYKLEFYIVNFNPTTFWIFSICYNQNMPVHTVCSIFYFQKWFSLKMKKITLKMRVRRNPFLKAWKSTCRFSFPHAARLSYRT